MEWDWLVCCLLKDCLSLGSKHPSGPMVLPVGLGDPGSGTTLLMSLLCTLLWVINCLIYIRRLWNSRKFVPSLPIRLRFLPDKYILKDLPCHPNVSPNYLKIVHWQMKYNKQWKLFYIDNIDTTLIFKNHCITFIRTGLKISPFYWCLLCTFFSISL